MTKAKEQRGYKVSIRAQNILYRVTILVYVKRIDVEGVKMIKDWCIRYCAYHAGVSMQGVDYNTVIFSHATMYPPM